MIYHVDTFSLNAIVLLFLYYLRYQAKMQDVDTLLWHCFTLYIFLLICLPYLFLHWWWWLMTIKNDASFLPKFLVHLSYLTVSYNIYYKCDILTCHNCRNKITLFKCNVVIRFDVFHRWFFSCKQNGKTLMVTVMVMKWNLVNRQKMLHEWVFLNLCADLFLLI